MDLDLGNEGEGYLKTNKTIAETINRRATEPHTAPIITAVSSLESEESLAPKVS